MPAQLEEGTEVYAINEIPTSYSFVRRAIPCRYWYCPCTHSYSVSISYLHQQKVTGASESPKIPSIDIGCVRSHQIPAIPESVSQSVPFDYIFPELEWPEFNSADSGLEAEF